MTFIKFIALILGVLTASTAFGSDEGEMAPELQAKLDNGQSFSVKAQQGKVILIHFWATWCDACKLEMPLLNNYYKHHHQEGLQMIGIDMDSGKDESKAREFMKNYDFQWGKAKEATYKGVSGGCP